MPKPHGESDDGEVIPCRFLEAAGDSAELLEFAETALDEVALGMEVLVDRVFLDAGPVLGTTAAAPLSAMALRSGSAS